jgi:maltooligosyltrehalose trehalohydrolase
VHRDLLALRKAQPELVDADLSAVRVRVDEDQRWLVIDRGSLRVVANLSDRPRDIELDRPATGVVFATGEKPALDRTTVTLSAESAAVLSTC